MARSVVILLILVMLAGCTDKAPDGTQEECQDLALCDLEEHFSSHHCVKNDVSPRIYAPDTPGPDADADPWREGDWWRYQLSVDGEDLGTTQLIYYDIQDQGAHYMVGTPTREEALQHAVQSVNPVIGRIHKTLYSPHESGEHADMFHFPLCEGSTWSSFLFATDLDFTARHTELSVPGGGTDPLGFTITGTDGQGSRVVITYSPVVKWFTGIDLQRADGTSVVLELQEYGSGASGDAYFLRGQQDEVVAWSQAAEDKTQTVARDDGRSGPYDSVGVHLDLTRTSGQSRAVLRLLDPTGERVACVAIEGNDLGAPEGCPVPPLLAEVPYVQGDYRVELDLPLLQPPTVNAQATVVSIYDRSGTV